MAFALTNWTCISSSLNEGQLTVTPFGGSPTLINAPNVFVYGSVLDTVATIIAADYFLDLYNVLKVNDIILGNGSDASFAVTVTAVSATTVTVASMGLTTSIGTANITNLAVTTAKIDNLAVTTAKIDNNAVTSAKMATNLLQYATAAITAAEFNGMFAAPKLLLAAGGANTLIVLERMVLAMTFGSAAFAGGGVVAAQWDATVNGAGQHATNIEAAADFFAAASSAFMFVGNSGNAATQDGGLVPFAANVNKGIYLSNKTGAFTTGTGSSFVAHLWYRIIPTV
jgi:hypothetical protein